MGFQEYLRIKAAAAVLGVSETTLRNWERSGKLVTYRHPVNRHRLYKRADLDALLASVEQPPQVPVRHSTTVLTDE
ncbi:MAG: helix-turn-helix domain-containing protein [Chloroflexales bacterium]